MYGDWRAQVLRRSIYSSSTLASVPYIIIRTYTRTFTRDIPSVQIFALLIIPRGKISHG